MFKTTNKKTKIILFNFAAIQKSQLAGVAVYSREMLTEIVNNEKNRQFLIILNREVRSYFSIDQFPNLKVLYLGSLFKKQTFRIFFELFLLPFIVLFKQIDLIFTPYVSTPIFANCEKVTVIHDIAPLVMKKYSYVRHIYIQFMMYLSMRFANKIVTVSETSKNDLIKHYPTYKNKVTYIHNGVSKCTKIIDVSEFKKKYNFKFILFVGSIQPSKNLIRLIEAYGLMEQDVDEKMIIVGGKGWLVLDELSSLISKYRLDEKVIFKGYVDSQELAYLYSNTTFLVFPSLYEGFGFPPLEAMSYGSAVLASNQASIPEVCGDAALYVDPYSVADISTKMMQLCTDTALREELIELGQSRVKNFNWSKSSKQLLNIFDEKL